MNFLEALTGFILFIFTCVLLFAVFVVPFIIAWYICSLLLVNGVVWWAIYIFAYIMIAGMMRWSMKLILDINGDEPK